MSRKKKAPRVWPWWEPFAISVGAIVLALVVTQIIDLGHAVWLSWNKPVTVWSQGSITIEPAVPFRCVPPPDMGLQEI